MQVPVYRYLFTEPILFTFFMVDIMHLERYVRSLRIRVMFETNFSILEVILASSSLYRRYTEYTLLITFYAFYSTGISCVG